MSKGSSINGDSRFTIKDLDIVLAARIKQVALMTNHLLQAPPMTPFGVDDPDDMGIR